MPGPGSKVNKLQPIVTVGAKEPPGTGRRPRNHANVLRTAASPGSSTHWLARTTGPKRRRWALGQGRTTSALHLYVRLQQEPAGRTASQVDHRSAHARDCFCRGRRDVVALACGWREYSGSKNEYGASPATFRGHSDGILNRRWSTWGGWRAICPASVVSWGRS